MTSPLFSAKEFCFPKQYEFIKDPTRFKIAVCSRRSGKTVGIAADLIDTCLAEQDVVCLYTTLTHRNAKNIIWPDIKRILDKYKIPNKADNTLLEISFLETKSKLILGGAKDESEIEKYRGWKLRKAYIDECQSFRPYVKYFIDDILIPALRDLRGSLILTGTPGPIPAGPFYEYATSNNWKHFHWTAFDNPYMHNPPLRDLNKTLAEERIVKGITENDPGYIRETYGQWIEDFNSLVFKFSPEKNIFSKLPDKKYDYVFGIDIGFHDSDAIAVLAYNLEDKNVYLVEEVIRDRQGITPLVAQIETLRARYNPVKMVMDTGGLGKKIQEELRMRHQIPIVAAEKTRKFEFIELLNDDLRTAKFKSYQNSRFQQDCSLVQWDRKRSDKLTISDTYHSDITDAVLYGWRECRHFLATLAPEKPKYGTREYWESEAKRIEDLEDEYYSKSETKEFWAENIDLETKEFWEKD